MDFGTFGTEQNCHFRHFVETPEIFIQIQVNPVKYGESWISIYVPTSNFYPVFGSNVTKVTCFVGDISEVRSRGERFKNNNILQCTVI